MLVAVTFILRHKFENTDAPDELASIVSEYLVADVPLHEYLASDEINSRATELLDFVWDRGLRDANGSRWSVVRQLHSNPHYFQWEFHQSMCQASRHGHVAVAHWVLEHFPGCPILKDVMNQAAVHNHLDLLQLFEAQQPGRDVEWSTDSLDAASREGHWDIIRWLDERVGTPEARKINTFAMDCAIRTNQVEEVRWLGERGFGVPRFARLASTNSESWEAQSQIVRFLLEGGYDAHHDYFSTGLKAAAEAGDLEFVKWMVVNYSPKTREFPESSTATILTMLEASKDAFMGSLAAASSNGHRPVMEWLLNYTIPRGCQEAPARAALAAAASGNLELVQWLYEQYGGDPGVGIFQFGLDSLDSNSLICNSAAINGHLDVVSYLRQIALLETSPRSRRALRFSYKANDGAAVNGHLDVLQWVCDRNVGKPYTSDALDQVASMCPHSRRFSCCSCQPSESFVAKQVTILDFLNNHFTGGSTTRAIDGAARKGNLRVLQWLHENTEAGCTTNAMDHAAREDHLDVVKWLHENRWEGCTFEAFENAAKKNLVIMMKWLCQNRSEIAPARAMNSAARHGHLEMVKWLQTRYPQQGPEGTLEEAASKSLPIVQWLLPKCEGVNIMVLIELAVHAQQFEVVLFFHSQRRVDDYSVNDATRIKANLLYQIRYRPKCRYMQAWFEENYPLP